MTHRRDRYWVTFVAETQGSAQQLRDHYQYNNHPRDTEVTQVSVTEMDSITLDEINPRLIRPSKNPGNRRETYRVVIPGLPGPDGEQARERSLPVFDPFVDHIKLKQILADNGFIYF